MKIFIKCIDHGSIMRAFLALSCDEAADAFRRMQAVLPKKGLSFPKDFHLTLRFFRELDEIGYDHILHKFRSLRFSPFSVELDKVWFFPDASFIRVVWVGVTPNEEVRRLKKEVDELLSGYWRYEKRFVPHITLARVKGKQPGLYEAAMEIEVPKISLRFDALHLIESSLTPEGPQYETKATFPFQE